MNNKKLIPELRFPEFKNEGEWEIKTIDEVGNVVASGDLDSSSFSSLPSDKHIYPVYSNSVSNEGLYGYNTYSKYKPNSVTITARGTLGVAFVRKNEFIGIGRLLVLSDFNKTDAVFFKENWNHFAKVPLENGGIPQLTAVKAKSVTLLFPKEIEQQHIASCLSSLDEVIAAHSQKLDLLKHHKKGLMQNLLPKEGENVPKYRFKEFIKNGEWDEKVLGDICDVRDGTHDSPKYVTKGYPLITSKNLLSNGIMDFTNVNYLTEEDYVQINKRSKVDVGDILFGMIGTIGNPVIVKTKGFAIKNVALIKDIGKLNQEFLLHQLKSDFILKQFEKVNAGGILKFIALGIIRNLKVIVPSPEEQQKIASCLSSLDALITAQVEKIEQLKIHKKGLMQGLFPKMSE